MQQYAEKEHLFPYENFVLLIEKESDLEEAATMLKEWTITTNDRNSKPETYSPYEAVRNGYTGNGLEEQIKTFNAIVKVFHNHGLNVCKTQLSKSMENLRKEVKAELGLGENEYFHTNFTLRMLLPIEDDALDQRINKEEGGYSSSGFKRRDQSLSKQLKDWKESRESVLERIVQAQMPFELKGQFHYDLTELKSFIEELTAQPKQELTETNEKYLKKFEQQFDDLRRRLQNRKTRIFEFTSGRDSRNLGGIDYEIEKLEWMIENHQGTIIRPPK
tara:strand:+ start:2318 stop:3142 length:825 start_codon:yes stop_codon:yes gene_type:complete